jgi:Flp pilus assembly protein TadG
MIFSFVRDERGQALVETAFFLPVLILAMFAMIFFSQLGVLDERAQTAVRFGGNVAYQHGQPYVLATLQDLIADALNPSSTQLAVLCTGGSGQPVPVQQAALDAFTQNQGNKGSVAPTAYAGPSAAPFWKPTTSSAPACNPATLQLSTSASSPIVPASLTQISVTGNLNVPPYLRFLYGGASTTQITGGWNVVNVALPSQLLACNVPLLSVIEIVVAAPTNKNASAGC